MIRIEGIPVVAARLVDAQKAKSKTRHKTKGHMFAAGVKAPFTVRSKRETKTKVA